MYIKYGLEVLIFDLRIDYHTRNNFKDYQRGNHFGSAYFCKNVLPDKLVFEKLKKYNRELK